VSVGDLVQYVGEVLGRSRALFGEPTDAAGRAATGTAARLNDAARPLIAGQRRFASLSGDFATGYDRFTRRAGPALDRLAGLEDRVGGVLTDAADSDRRGRAQAGAVVNGAASDTAALAPWSGTPAGERLLLTQLRGRLAQQRRVVAAYRARDAQLAAMVRAMCYRGRFRPGERGIPWGGPPLGSALPSPPLLSGLTRAAATRNTHRIHRAARHDPRTVPGGPGAAAVAAALTRRGDQYVWGAKGPNRFDCSGLTQWAWRQAGVQLGGDTYAQIHDGVPVAPGQVRAGDLIFPMDAFDAHGPGHVQLAVSANEVIHAPESGDVVRLAPMPSSYVARRPVPSQ
jgi:cell wall-associated NlpC family hydrolase